MATTRTLKAAIRHKNGHQVLVLPDDIRFDGDEVVISQKVDTGEVTFSGMTPQNHWKAVFDAIDAHGPIPEDEWDAYRERIESARVSRQERNSFDNMTDR